MHRAENVPEMGYHEGCILMHNRSSEFQPTHIPPEREHSTGALQQSSKGLFHLETSKNILECHTLILLSLPFPNINIISKNENSLQVRESLGRLNSPLVKAFLQIQ